ncbi:invasion associated locus B family protein [Acuticoccus sp. M5D2P5]|uniref:invasion associated locus B family protein n=1 Tax=Acuticoccus kalidii TaxID=2910977 RepID=UPI001F43E015|nr:invasion associated locus B family protein [Acuticoccus kalidii]MCF3932570.1 invasion associated locus B family protein [Acuticoccus kalidii]
MRLAKMFAALAFATAAAFPAAPSIAQEASDDNAWVKICNRDPQANKELCLITQELRTDSGQFLASVAIREAEGEARKSLLASVPVGMLIQPGVQLQIDGNQAQQARYSICFPNACYAELAIDAAYVNRLKGGGKLQVTTMNQQAKPVRFDLTLMGFTSAYDGSGIDPQALEQKQADLQRQLEERAQAARDRLVAEQRRAIEDANQ